MAKKSEKKKVKTAFVVVAGINEQLYGPFADATSAAMFGETFLPMNLWTIQPVYSAVDW